MTDDPEGRVDWEESDARYDDYKWSWYVMKLPFTWQRYINWWVARRWVEPRDVRKR